MKAFVKLRWQSENSQRLSLFWLRSKVVIKLFRVLKFAAAYTLYEWMSAALHTACTCTLYRAQNCTFHNFLLLNAHRFPHLNGRCCVLSLQSSAVDLVSLPSVTSNFRVSASTNPFVHLIEAKKKHEVTFGLILNNDRCVSSCTNELCRLQWLKLVQYESVMTTF